MRKLFKQLITSILVATLFCSAAINANAVEKGAYDLESGIVKETSVSAIDYGNVQDGYVLVKYTAKSDTTIKALVTKNGGSSQYVIQPGEEWTTLTLTDGDGVYAIGIYQQIKGTSYRCVQKITVDAEIEDPNAPFTISTTQVNYSNAPNTVAVTAEVTTTCETDKAKADAIQEYIVGHISYDYDKAAAVTSTKMNYVADLDAILEGDSGICADYAPLMCGMLRSQGIPAKMVYGYVQGGRYHAWVMAYIDGEWVRYDPTFYDSKDKASMSVYIANDANYSEAQVF